MMQKRPIVIGSTGSLGRQIALQAKADGLPPVVLSRRTEPGGRKFDALTGRLTDVVPDLGAGDCVYFAFGITSPNQAHAEPETAWRLNVEATIRLLDETLERGGRAVFFSTELVFNGKSGGYTEQSSPDPTNEYGRQKFFVENHLYSRNGDWIIVRTGATVMPFLGGNCAIEKTYASLLAPGCQMGEGNIFSLTDGRETAKAFLSLCRNGETGIYHFVGSPPVERTELAAWIAADSEKGGRMAFRAVPYETLVFPEPRPLRSFMTGARTLKRLGFQFSSPRESVRKKVALLDMQSGI